MKHLQINLISLAIFNNAENGNFHSKHLLALSTEGVASAINATNVVASYIIAVDKLKDAIKKQLGTIITDEMHTLDAKRDKELMYIINSVRNASNSPIAAEETAGANLMQLVAAYTSIQTHPRGQKTQEITGFVADMKAPVQAAHIEALGLLPTIEQLLATNKAYIEKDYERSIDRSEHKSHTVELRTLADDLYKEITLKANATQVITPAVIVEDFINHVNAVINTTKTEYNLRMSHHAESEPTPTPDPTPDPSGA